jgi:hypothetical protein
LHGPAEVSECREVGEAPKADRGFHVFAPERFPVAGG